MKKTKGIAPPSGSRRGRASGAAQNFSVKVLPGRCPGPRSIFNRKKTGMTEQVQLPLRAPTDHPTLSPSFGSLRSIQMVFNSVY